MSKRHIKTWIAVILATVVAVPAGAQAGDKKIVHLELKGPLQEAPPDPMAMFASSKAMNTKGLLDHLKKMRRDNDVEAVFFEPEDRLAVLLEGGVVLAGLVVHRLIQVPGSGLDPRGGPRGSVG